MIIDVNSQKIINIGDFFWNLLFKILRDSNNKQVTLASYAWISSKINKLFVNSDNPISKPLTPKKNLISWKGVKIL